MKRSSKIIWIGTVFTTIVIAAVAGIVVYFTAFNDDSGTASPTTSQPPPSSSDPSAPTVVPSSPPTEGGSTNSETGGTGTAGTIPSPDSSDNNNSSSTTTTTTTTPPSSTGSSTQLQFDHLSHAVPGFEYHAIDFDGDGKHPVKLDGSRSHTHYTYGEPIQQGKLTYINWFNNQTKASLASTAQATVSFPVGTTIVGLTVQDDSMDSHTAYATVIVEPPILPNTYCYYYRLASPTSSDFTIDDDLLKGDKPIYGQEHKSIDFANNNFPKYVVDSTGGNFQMRCVFVLTAEQDAQDVSFSITHQGHMKLLVDNQLIVSSDSVAENVESTSTSLSKGYHNAQLLYVKLQASTGKLKVSMTGNGNGNALQYDASKLIPIIKSTDTLTITLGEAEGKMTIDGLNFENGIQINFDGKPVTPVKESITNTSVTVIIPASDSEKRVSISATNNVGESNSVEFDYLSNGKPAIVFSEGELKLDNGKDLDIQLMTGIIYGPDHRYYVSAIHSTLYSMEVDNNLKVAAGTYCKSASLGKFRSILGMAFNPADGDADDNFKLYVSGSILEWEDKERLTGPDAWANGEIILVQKNVNGACLGMVRSVISGLPVTNHDHGVNGLEFDQDGKLHIQVGGFTNAGVLHETKLGGLASNPLSGASLIADITKVGFNGNIKYSNYNNLAVTNQIAGDISVYMSGFRNSFAITLHSNGHLYATDNGASVGFGARSINCSHEQELTGANIHDELIRLVPGKYAGHPNRNRGRKDKRQCVFRGPEEKSDDFYQAPVATFESSTNGIVEYNANTFDRQLKGNLLCSKFATQDSPGKVFRVQLNQGGDLATPQPSELWDKSGLTIAVTPWGDILTPRVFGKRIIALKAKRSFGNLIPSFIAVAPFRGPKNGGNWVIVTGEDLATGATALFNGRECTDTTDVESDRRSFRCKVPQAKEGDTAVQVSLRFPDSRLNTPAGQGVDYMYMK